jgi:hypothetical protein
LASTVPVQTLSPSSRGGGASKHRVAYDRQDVRHRATNADGGTSNSID